jgi:hypothetical protein
MQANTKTWVKAGICKQGVQIHLTTGHNSNGNTDCWNNGMRGKRIIVQRLAFEMTTFADVNNTKIAITKDLSAKGYNTKFCEGCFGIAVA